MLSDYRREVIKQWNLEPPDFAGLKGYTVAKRSIFILDQAGSVRYVWISEDPSVEPTYEETQKNLEKIP